jgi:uncharacterized protein with HEPN domain
MSRNPRLYLEDIKHCCEKVIKYTDGLSFAEFQRNELILTRAAWCDLSGYLVPHQNERKMPYPHF